MVYVAQLLLAKLVSSFIRFYVVQHPPNNIQQLLPHTVLEVNIRYSICLLVGRARYLSYTLHCLVWIHTHTCVTNLLTTHMQRVCQQLYKLLPTCIWTFCCFQHCFPCGRTLLLSLTLEQTSKVTGYTPLHLLFLLLLLSWPEATRDSCE